MKLKDIKSAQIKKFISSSMDAVAREVFENCIPPGSECECGGKWGRLPVLLTEPPNGDPNQKHTAIADTVMCDKCRKFAMKCAKEDCAKCEKLYSGKAN